MSHNPAFACFYQEHKCNSPHFLAVTAQRKIEKYQKNGPSNSTLTVPAGRRCSSKQTLPLLKNSCPLFAGILGLFI